ncbi:MAG: hypothetical protein GQ576_00425 [Methanococcoides sp.]|nr:hypothetical protein [Methanococcoides sp.]
MNVKANIKQESEQAEEGIWIEIPNKYDQDTYNRDTKGDEIKVIVLNNALCGEPMKTFGMETVAITRGKMNPLIVIDSI